MTATNTENTEVSELPGNENQPTLPQSINAFYQPYSPVENPNTTIYQFNSEELGKAHDNEKKPYKARIENKGSKLKLTLLTCSEEEIKSYEIEYGQNSPITISEGTNHAESILWDWAVYLRQSYHHPARNTLESLGRTDVYNPTQKTEKAIHGSEWHHSTSVDYISSRSGYSSSRSYSGGNQTRIEFQRTTKDRRWYIGKVCISFYHKGPNAEEIEPQYVYKPYIYVSYRLIKPVSERRGEYDRSELHRIELLSCERDDKFSVEEIVSKVEEAMETLVSKAEIQRCERIQKIQKEAERRWDPEKEEYRDQTGITNW